jgi:hypothetical protein
MAGRATRAADVPFQHVVNFLEHVKAAKPKKKIEHLQAFRRTIDRSWPDVYDIYRLLLPEVLHDGRKTHITVPIIVTIVCCRSSTATAATMACSK